MGYYETQMKVNVFLKEKFKGLIVGEYKELDIHKLMLEITTQYPIGQKYVMQRIKDLLKEYTIIVQKEDKLLIE